MTWRIVRPLRTRLAPFARFGEHGAGGRDRVFKGSKVDLTSRPRYEKERRKKTKAMHARIYVKLTIRSNEDRTRIERGSNEDHRRISRRFSNNDILINDLVVPRFHLVSHHINPNRFGIRNRHPE